jgi:inosine-uridine nucleoside N-ribohydrolase
MARKVVLVADPGIDGALAIALAVHDRELDVLGVAATAGNVEAEQASKNAQIVVEQVDPPRWPRLGAALPAEYPMDGKRLHGSKGLGASDLPCAQLHHSHPSDKLLIDLIRQHPKDITVITMGPLTVLARAFDRDPELPALVHRLICVGGSRYEAGNASAVAEFHFFLDPQAARQVLRCGAPITLLPLDISQRLVLSPADLLELGSRDSRACRFLRQILPFGIGASSNLYGIEGFHVRDVLGIVALAAPEAVTTKPVVADVETRGELTRGMSVFDMRPGISATPNVDLGVSVDAAAVRNYAARILQQTS